MGCILLWKRDRAAVQAVYPADKLRLGDMRVSVYQHCAPAERRKCPRIEMMTVREEKLPFVGEYHRAGLQYGEFQNHLVDLGITVPANAKQIVFKRVEQLYDILWCVTLGEIVPRSVVQDISEQTQLSRLFPFICRNHFFTPQRRTVDIGCEH